MGSWLFELQRGVRDRQLAFQVVKVDLAGLVDYNEVAEMLHLSASNAVSTHRRRYDVFSEPVV